MKSYVGTKIIQAESMDEHTFLSSVMKENVEDRDNRAGYKVVYPDNYISWSPKNVFEQAYREITAAEKQLI